jgi:hypothetical protein
LPRLTGGGLDAEVRFVRFTDDRGEPFIDPRGYLDRLPELAGALPPGARAFATDPAHYDFSGGRCVKDLTLRHQVSDPEEDLFELRFVHYRGKQGAQAMRAAIVTGTVASLDPDNVAAGHVPALDSDEHVHLWVFTPGESGGFAEFNVSHAADSGDVPPGSWCWPPRV